MRNGWVPLPEAPLLLTASAPRLFERDRASDLRDELLSQGVRAAAIDLSTVATRSEFFDQLRTVLVFPDWCGSGWDSLDDAFEEIRLESSFPCFVLIYGLQDMLPRDLHLALEVVIRLSELEGAFSVAGEQFVVAYEVGPSA